MPKCLACLAALAACPTEDETIAPGAVHFLRAIEGSFQTRQAQGLTDRSGLLPPLPLGPSDNPAPLAFDPAVITRIFSEAEVGLAGAISGFAALPDGSPAAPELALGDVWFDVTRNASRNALADGRPWRHPPEKGLSGSAPG